MQKHTFDYHYDGTRIPYSVWFSDSSDRVDMVIFLGTVQINKLPEWVAGKCPPRTAVVQGAPHWYAKPDGSDMSDFILYYTANAFSNIVATKKVTKVNAIGESQAAAAALLLFALIDGNEQYLRDMVLIQPLGFSKRVFCGTAEERVALFKKRIIKNGSRQLARLLLDRHLRYNHLQLSKMVNLKDPVCAAQYNSGLAFDVSAELRKLHELGHNIHIVCGAKDTIFPAREIRDSLRAESVPIEVTEVKGAPHSPLATKQGTRLLNQALELLK